MFSGKRFVTSGIAEKVPLLLQVIMWDMIDTMDEPKDHLQVFDLSEENGKQKIVHSQEQPEYKDRKSTRLNSSHNVASRMPSSA